MTFSDLQEGVAFTMKDDKNVYTKIAPFNLGKEVQNACFSYTRNGQVRKWFVPISDNQEVCMNV